MKKLIYIFLALILCGGYSHADENTGGKTMKKITQTAGRDSLGTFAPEFAHFNDDILFGENWNNEDIDLKTRSIITVVTLVSQGMTDSSLQYRRRSYTHGILCRLAKGLGRFSFG